MTDNTMQLFTTRIDIAAETRQAVIEVLNAQLADTFDSDKFSSQKSDKQDII